MGKPNPQNLKPFKKGQSGNPAGRPPSKHIEERFQEFLSQVARSKNGEEMERLEVIMRAMFQRASSGDTRAAQLILDRAFGKAKQDINIGGQEDNPINIMSMDEKRKSVIERLIKTKKDSKK